MHSQTSQPTSAEVYCPSHHPMDAVIEIIAIKIPQLKDGRVSIRNHAKRSKEICFTNINMYLVMIAFADV